MFCVVIAVALLFAVLDTSNPDMRLIFQGFGSIIVLYVALLAMFLPKCKSMSLCSLFVSLFDLILIGCVHSFSFIRSFSALLPLCC